jgi:hypothetical protein
MLTIGSKSPSGPLRAATFSAAIFANAVPQDPEPTMATRCFPDGRGDGGRGLGMGEDGRVAAIVEKISSFSKPVIQLDKPSLQLTWSGGRG